MPAAPALVVAVLARSVVVEDATFVLVAFAVVVVVPVVALARELVVDLLVDVDVLVDVVDVLVVVSHSLSCKSALSSLLFSSLSAYQHRSERFPYSRIFPFRLRPPPRKALRRPRSTLIHEEQTFIETDVMHHLLSKIPSLK